MDAASERRVKVLEQLMGVYRDLESVPAALESAYREQNPADAAMAVPEEEKVSTG